MANQDMQTECPSCHTVFAVSETDLGRAGGKVRCGDCLSVFNATENVHDALPEPADTTPDFTDASTPSDTQDIEPAPISMATSDDEPPQTEDDLAAMLEASYLIEVPESGFLTDETANSGEPDHVESVPEQGAETDDDPAEQASNDEPNDQDAATTGPGNEHYDDSGMFRFSDDTPAEVLDKELEALVTADDAADEPIMTDREPSETAGENQSGVAGDLSNTETHVGDDWDDLLSELDDDFATTSPETSSLAKINELTLEDDVDAQASAATEDDLDSEPVDTSLTDGTGDTPLDFQLGDGEEATPAAALDLDLTRTDDTDHSDAVDQHDELWLSPESDGAETGAVDHVIDESDDAVDESQTPAWTDSDILDDVSAALADEESAPNRESSHDANAIADVIPVEHETTPDASETKNTDNEDDRFDQDALSSFLTAGDLFLADESADDKAEVIEPVATDPPEEAVATQAENADTDAEAVDDSAESSNQNASANADASSNDNIKPTAAEEPADSEDDPVVADNADGEQQDAINENEKGTDADESDIFADEPVEEIVLSTKSVEQIDMPSQSDADLFAESMILSAEAYQPRRRLWTSLSALAIVGLAIQAIHLNRGYLATTSPWSKFVTPVYETIGIPITPDWDIRALCIQRSGSALGDTTLDIETLFQNQASRAMPLPLIKIDITDNFEDVIASTVVAPQDYLSDGNSTGTRLAAGKRQMANVALSFTESRADKFELSLCYAGKAGQLRCGADICGTR
ncbi:MAG: DUF3426 domain-containing protein [Woeseiaceae bacterium]